MKVLAALVAAGLLSAVGYAQSPKSGPWEMQQSGTTASLRGIHAVGGGVAWASGTDGTVLRTEDSGYMWQSCAMPPGAEKLDFRGIWAWDADTAIVMSSGPGDQSRLYKTTDGCSHWTLLFTNPDKDGFWDAIAFQFQGRDKGFILGDPVDGRFVLFFTVDGGKTWDRVNAKSLDAGKTKIGAFAASNSAMILDFSGFPVFGTSGPGGPWLYLPDVQCTALSTSLDPAGCFRNGLSFIREKLPIAGDSASAGVFALTVAAGGWVAVGGDYTKPDEASGTVASITSWNGISALTLTPTVKPPHGYRSTIAVDNAHAAWVAAGTNGSDISYDDGKTWQPLDNGNWNALSLPWIVGPKGRIAKLGALPAQK
jgi:photosystem II stability/assembly factor-like uncharacterized protein